MQVGLIGFGRLGSLFSKFLAQDSNLYVFNQGQNHQEISQLGATPVEKIEDLKDCKIIIPTVPISELKNVCEQLATFISKESLVIDVCSVKEKPVEWMLESLPKEVSILGTHPMFGPDSAMNTLYGSKMVLTPVRIDDQSFENISRYLETNGIKVIKASAEEHDKQIAHSLLLTHFIGRGLIDFGIKDLEIDTKGYRRLMKILGTVENDSWQLFEDMNQFNPYAKEVRESFVTSLKNIIKRLEE
tara:strand:+ start:15972 stop:16703 length:732 start_codon:yes stop_codon:yes gene_type:complete